MLIFVALIGQNIYSLPEFSYNNAIQESIKHSPFYANYGYNPRHSLAIPSSLNVPWTDEIIKDFSELVKEQKKKKKKKKKLKRSK